MPNPHNIQPATPIGCSECKNENYLLDGFAFDDIFSIRADDVIPEAVGGWRTSILQLVLNFFAFDATNEVTRLDMGLI